ncbi:Exostosin family protein-like [Rhynchospora pubera]|uniref:Exostosin family protein-like n=1 Tax=Rhynchospora pubera TaxID=906938 RepID=A0AAV8C8V8_9POAL|nr:Exostosin family protein-like [Rhynchospora pubera]
MAGRRLSLANPRSISISKPLLLLLSLFSLLALFLLISPKIPNTNPYRSAKAPTRYFPSALDEFFSSSNPICSATSSSVQLNDPFISRREKERLYGTLSDPWAGSQVLQVYVYEMPSKFTCDLLKLFRDTYKETTNLTSNGSPVHRLIEQHSIDYWLWRDLIAPESERLLKNVRRVYRQEEADLFYIPFFTTISFFLLEKQECKALYREALKWVTDQPAWKRSEGRDHILPVHHPWSFKSVRRFMKKAIWLLPDMDNTGNWYKPGEVCLTKDVILPYVPNVELCDTKCLLETRPKRATLLFFRGRLKRNAGGKIRSKLGAVLNGADGVIIEEGTAGEGGRELAQHGMRRSVFCLSPAGDTPSSARLFDAIVSGCIPVVISDELEVPFEGLLRYNRMVLFVNSSDAVQPGWLLKYLRGIDSTKIREMQTDLAEYSRHFVYSSPALPLGPEDLTWRMIAGKLTSINQCIARSTHMEQGPRFECTCKAGNNTRVRASL